MFKAGLEVEILLLQLLDCVGVPRAASHLRPIGGGGGGNAHGGHRMPAGF